MKTEKRKEKQDGFHTSVIGCRLYILMACTCAGCFLCGCEEYHSYNAASMDYETECSSYSNDYSSKLAYLKACADQRGYMTVAEAQLALNYIKEMLDQIQQKRDLAAEQYSKADNSNYSTMHPAMQWLVSSPSSRRRSAEALEEEAQNIQNEAAAWVDWMVDMKNAGRIR